MRPQRCTHARCSTIAAIIREKTIFQSTSFHETMHPGTDIGGNGMGLIRMVRPWNEWLVVWGYDVNEPEPDVTEEFATGVANQSIGDPELEIELLSANTWTVNNYYATEVSNGRVFCMGDAIHRHPRQTASARTPPFRTPSTSPGNLRWS